MTVTVRKLSTFSKARTRRVWTVVSHHYGPYDAENAVKEAQALKIGAMHGTRYAVFLGRSLWYEPGRS